MNPSPSPVLSSDMRADPHRVLDALARDHGVPEAVRAQTQERARDLVEALRADSNPGLMETFLAEYGLSTDEGVALMCLAEALLRVPDADTMDALIEDKIAPSEWGTHLGRSSSSLVNASTWGLMLTGKVLDTEESRGIGGVLHGMIKRLGEPVIRVAVGRVMKELGGQFVLGQTMKEALKRTREGYTYSYDMLGEAAMTHGDAQRYYDSYFRAIETLAPECRSDDIRRNPGISVKLSALHPRYDELQRDAMMPEMVSRVRSLAKLAATHRMGLNIDAEEADRLELSLDVFGAVIGDGELSGWGGQSWGGLGMVVQAYSVRAPYAIERVGEMARAAGETCMVRLVKGAYWDTEIKRAQVEGADGFPVFTRKADTDAAYLMCARDLLARVPDIYPQFATHNAHSAAAILAMAEEMGVADDAFEFQRLHGMGEALHEIVRTREGTQCRVYAPVGAHRDLLAYLVRRLLENGANSSFVSQITDRDVPIEAIISDPLQVVGQRSNRGTVAHPSEIFGARRNSRGWDLRERAERETYLDARNEWAGHVWEAGPITTATVTASEPEDVTNPAHPDQEVGTCRNLDSAATATVMRAAVRWDAPVSERAQILRVAADRLETESGEIFALLTREAGKSALDTIAELREAVDFLRYYADEAERRGELEPAGIVAAISPWNFPLAIFIGQVAAALSMGCGVVAKPAETTPLIAHRAVEWLHEAGVPRAVLHFVPGTGREVGAAMTRAREVAGVVFTGSTQTAQIIHRSLAAHAPEAFLIAETGGLNAMIVDSTALPEQVVRDVVAGAFQSAGQRCSALRCLYVQDDVAENLIEMLSGAMETLVIGDPWDLSTDVGPVIDAAAMEDQRAYLKDKQFIAQQDVPDNLSGHFVPPSLIRVSGIAEMKREVFGPVLHVATYPAKDLMGVVEAINATGYGLTFGLHTRIDDRVEDVTRAVEAGNIYVNRNQIGAVVGSQPFGGEGLSGTGPKAGGPHYLDRFAKADRMAKPEVDGRTVSVAEVQAAIDALPHTPEAAISVTDMPGPTGESNRLSTFARGPVLCLGPDADSADVQAGFAALMECPALRIAPGAVGDDAIDGVMSPEMLRELNGFAVVAYWGEEAGPYRTALAAREGAILPLVLGMGIESYAVAEKHVCVDTTAAGGNASLLASVGAKDA